MGILFRGRQKQSNEAISSEARERPLVLASASPRRARILKLAGIPFDVVPSVGEPAQSSCYSPQGLVITNATYKATRVAYRYCNRIVLGADTVIAVAGDILGKPSDAQQAHQMLKAITGRTHTVYTGFALTVCQQRHKRILWQEWAGTQVKLRHLSTQQIQAYVASGEPLDKAGAWAIQGQARSFVEWMRGSYYNVVGLPIRRVCHALVEVGWSGPQIESERTPTMTQTGGRRETEISAVDVAQSAARNNAFFGRYGY